MDVKRIVKNFQIYGDVTSVEPYGSGHINDTYRIRSGKSGERDCLLQRINDFVFRDVEGLMNNIFRVTSHLRQRLLANNIPDVERRSLHIIRTRAGKLYFQDPAGGCWRLFNFISNHKVYDKVPSTEIAFEGARMFGDFVHQLTDLDSKNIVPTIPNFHNVLFRLENLRKTVKKDPAGRMHLVKDEIEYAFSRYEIMSVIQKNGDKGIIPTRIVHNDTKINNILFDYHNKGLCVIDLDTVMPGYVHYDFGDGVRTCAYTGKEDEEDLRQVYYDMEMFLAFSAGYIESTGHMLSNEELNTLAHAALLFPFIMGVRFLTDYLAGDVYYKIHHPEQNIFRARTQLKLARDGESRLEEMQRVISRLGSKG